MRPENRLNQGGLKVPSHYFFKKNGDWGDADEMVLMDCTYFTEDDWEQIDRAPSSTRQELAIVIWQGYHGAN